MKTNETQKKWWKWRKTNEKTMKINGKQGNVRKMKENQWENNENQWKQGKVRKMKEKQKKQGKVRTIQENQWENNENLTHYNVLNITWSTHTHFQHAFLASLTRPYIVFLVRRQVMHNHKERRQVKQVWTTLDTSENMFHTSCRFATASVLVAEIGSLPTVLLISKVGPTGPWDGNSTRESKAQGAPRNGGVVAWSLLTR